MLFYHVKTPFFNIKCFLKVLILNNGPEIFVIYAQGVVKSHLEEFKDLMIASTSITLRHKCTFFTQFVSVFVYLFV